MENEGLFILCRTFFAFFLALGFEIKYGFIKLSEQLKGLSEGP
jgi:hypothetical protein